VVINCAQLLTGFDNKDEARELYSGYLRRHPHDKEVANMLSLL
jgi:hypothetical protein